MYYKNVGKYWLDYNINIIWHYDMKSVTDDDRLEEGEDDAWRGTVESWCWPRVGKSINVIGENRTRAVDVDVIELSLADM